MHTFIQVSIFALLAMASGGAHARSLATGPDGASDACATAACRFLASVPNNFQTAHALDIRIEPHGDHALLLQGAGLVRTGELSFFVKGITAADIRDRFSERTTGASSPIIALLLGFWSAGLVTLARLGW